MKKLPIISASLLLGALSISSCSTNKMAMNGANDNLYFMASDVKIATQYAVENNNPKTFQSLENENSLTEENFSARNVNPEYISRYQATSEAEESGIVYFDEGGSEQVAQGNINAYDNFYSANGNQNGNSPNINFNFGLGFGSMFSPWGMGFYDPFWGPGWGWRPGFSLSFGFGWGNPWMGMGWGNPWMMGWGNPWMMGWGAPGFGWGYPMYGWGAPIYAGRPIYVLPGGEYGGRRVVYGARPTRGAGITNAGLASSQAGVVPNTARAQARRAATTAGTSPRRISASENSRVASREFGTSQNDYYNSGRSRTGTVRNVNSPAVDRAINTRSSVPSARPSSAYDRGTNSRGATYPAGRYATSPSRSSSPEYNRSTNPSYNNSGRPSYNRSTSPSYNRSTSPSYNRSGMPSRSNSGGYSSPSRSSGSSSFSAPSRSSGGSSFSAPSRSSGGSVGGSSGGSRGGRGN
ncbi:hypothetical protein Aoki45_11660 [Algoriphagus sp. oki45]|uniref:hypothetical protein n=1 Tax=Algoriphagus sp. oki45 TaxID=3067294 RepID=UPI0027EA219F|nr:hypothetical protein Aoki45_11660 [Algoriphagus sp. oki45]